VHKDVPMTDTGILHVCGILKENVCAHTMKETMLKIDKFLFTRVVVLSKAMLLFECLSYNNIF